MDKPLILIDPLPRTLDSICDAPTRRRLENLGRLVISEDRAMPDEMVDQHLPETVLLFGQTAMPRERIERAGRLKAIFNVETNFLPNIDYAACRDRGVWVLAPTAAFADAVAESALGMAIDLARGITVADVPNLFFLLGPNTGLGHNSVVFMIESQIRYVADAIKTCDKLGAQALAPTRAAQDAFNGELQRKLADSVWNTGGCSSWYLDEHGNNTVLWGGYTWQYWMATRSVKPAEYQFFGVGTGSRANRATSAV